MGNSPPPPLPLVQVHSDGTKDEQDLPLTTKLDFDWISFYLPMPDQWLLFESQLAFIGGVTIDMRRSISFHHRMCHYHDLDPSGLKTHGWTI